MIKIITNYGSLAQEVFPDELRKLMSLLSQQRA